ncbi:T9SS type A sorting domain-containing protein [uncultured Algibacter sp.]|uniref:T9SS type A sorting domain-containing protein n=1 Tax=uncultured Algibacter sp. TaxID=298659 RepID=UPI00261A5260|nr:T9SS type A sorting domain-containing protein [uncultured Algibacter sp.]
MKKTILSLLLFTIYNFGAAQCTTNASNFGNNTVEAYEISGDVSVTLNSNNTITLDLGSNFETGGGPDIRAYLVNSDGLSDNDLKSTKIADLEHIEFGLVGCSGCNPVIPEDGAKSFTVPIPNGANIENYNRVFFYCLQFDAFWDFGNFTPYSSSNCNILSVEDLKLSAITIYPNPAKNFINLKGFPNNEVKIEIADILGKIAFSYTGLSNQEINISHLKSGIYILSVFTETGRTSKKLVIE